MKTLAAVSIVLMATAFASLAQQRYEKRLGPFLIFGPVHTIRDERATFTNKDGEFIEGSRTLSLTMTYNEDGTKQERTVYQPDGSIRSSTIDLYELDDRLLETTSFDGKGKTVGRVVRNYDNRKTLVDEVYYRPDGSISNRLTFGRRGDQRTIESVSYDENGVVLSRGTTITNPQTRSSDSLYYDLDRVIRSESARIETPDGRTVTERRQEGILREAFISDGKNGEEKIHYNPDGSIRTRERRRHEFDSYGNVIKTLRSIAKGDSLDFQPLDVVYRKIEYFEKD